MDELLRASDDSLPGLLATLFMSNARQRQLVPEIANWRRDPSRAIAFLSSMAADNVAMPARDATAATRATMVMHDVCFMPSAYLLPRFF
jgi:hypothetical protein